MYKVICTDLLQPCSLLTDIQRNCHLSSKYLNGSSSIKRVGGITLIAHWWTQHRTYVDFSPPVPWGLWDHVLCIFSEYLEVLGRVQTTLALQVKTQPYLFIWMKGALCTVYIMIITTKDKMIVTMITSYSYKRLSHIIMPPPAPLPRHCVPTRPIDVYVGLLRSLWKFYKYKNIPNTKINN